MNSNVLVVGDINIDYVFYADHIPKFGEAVIGKSFSLNFGGEGANQAISIAKLGCNVRILGAVGKDVMGKAAIENLEKNGVDCSCVTHTDKPTGAVAITVCGEEKQTILDAGANALVTPEWIMENRESFAWAKIIVMQYTIPDESILAVAKIARDAGKTIIVNPSSTKNADAEWYKYLD